MSEKKESGAAAFDPESMLKGMRDANMNAWAKMMTDLVNTDAYSGASAEMVNAWLATAGPLQQAVERAVTQTFRGMNVALAEDVFRLGERLTNIEMRLDDIEAKLDESLRKS